MVGSGSGVVGGGVVFSGMEGSNGVESHMREQARGGDERSGGKRERDGRGGGVQESVLLFKRARTRLAHS